VPELDHRGLKLGDVRAEAVGKIHVVSSLLAL
jgi:hypothetical protein